MEVRGTVKSNVPPTIVSHDRLGRRCPLHDSGRRDAEREGRRPDRAQMRPDRCGLDGARRARRERAGQPRRRQATPKSRRAARSQPRRLPGHRRTHRRAASDMASRPGSLSSELHPERHRQDRVRQPRTTLTLRSIEKKGRRHARAMTETQRRARRERRPRLRIDRRHGNLRRRSLELSGWPPTR